MELRSSCSTNRATPYALELMTWEDIAKYRQVVVATKLLRLAQRAPMQPGYVRPRSDPRRLPALYSVDTAGRCECQRGPVSRLGHDTQAADGVALLEGRRSGVDRRRRRVQVACGRGCLVHQRHRGCGAAGDRCADGRPLSNAKLAVLIGPGGHPEWPMRGWRKTRVRCWPSRSPCELGRRRGWTDSSEGDTLFPGGASRRQTVEVAGSRRQLRRGEETLTAAGCRAPRWGC